MIKQIALLLVLSVAVSAAMATPPSITPVYPVSYD